MDPCIFFQKLRHKGRVVTLSVPKHIIEDRYFDESLPVHRSPLTVVRTILNVDLPDVYLVNLCGAPAGSTVTATRGAFKDKYGQTVTGLKLEVTHPRYIMRNHKNSVILYKGTDDVLRLYIDYVLFNSSAPHGLGTLLFWRILRVCAGLKIPEVTLWAYGGRCHQTLKDGSRWSGYYFWPRIGFDGPLEQDEIDFFALEYPYYPDKLTQQTTVRGVMELDGGKGAEFWRYSGGSVHCSFPVSVGSAFNVLDRRVQDIVKRMTP